MNQMNIIGNLTRDPELRYTPSNVAVCNFTAAVNGRKSDEPAQFVRVTAWRQLGENCQRYLAKGRKVFVSGPATVSTWTTADGQPRAQIEITADQVEFISAKNDSAQEQRSLPQQAAPVQQQYTPVDTDELPF